MNTAAIIASIVIAGSPPMRSRSACCFGTGGHGNERHHRVRLGGYHRRRIPRRQHSDDRAVTNHPGDHWLEAAAGDRYLFFWFLFKE
jgi:hypothetical protein